MPGLTDPQLYEQALAVHRAQGRAVEELPAQAAGADELRAGTDVAALARTVQAVTAGVGLTWALERDVPLAQRIRHELDNVLSPHIEPIEPIEHIAPLTHIAPRHGHGPEES